MPGRVIVMFVGDSLHQRYASAHPNYAFKGEDSYYDYFSWLDKCAYKPEEFAATCVEAALMAEMAPDPETDDLYLLSRPEMPHVLSARALVEQYRSVGYLVTSIPLMGWTLHRQRLPDAVEAHDPPGFLPALVEGQDVLSNAIASARLRAHGSGREFELACASTGSAEVNWLTLASAILDVRLTLWTEELGIVRRSRARLSFDAAEVACWREAAARAESDPTYDIGPMGRLCAIRVMCD